MADIGKAYVQIIPKAEGISNEISSILDPATESEGKKGGLKLGKALVAALGSAAVVTGVKQFFSTALDLGGELQQNLGGTEAVFGDFAKDIQTSANDAYKNMGLSASDYMATANKMGSLFQGSGVEQQKSLEMTTEAMQRAADVASVMGIDTQVAMESIAGAAKGNFTMMDNLGVAMNATTLEAYALEKGVNFKWNTASNAEKAELAMKMFMDRTSQYAGNFARESQETLSGSIGATKAAFQDFMASLTTGGDVTGTLQKLLTSASTMLFNNVVPMVWNVVMAIPPAVTSAAQAIAPMVGTAFQTAMNNLPQYLDTGVQMVNGVVTGILQGLPSFMNSAFTLLTKFVTSIVQRLPVILSAGVQIVLNLVNGIIQNLPQIVGAAGRGIAQFVAGIGKVLPSVLQSGVQILAQLVVGIINSIPRLVAAVPQCISAFKSGFQGHNWAEIGTNIINGLVNGIKNGVGKIAEAAKSAAKSALDSAKSFLGIKSPSKVFEKEVGKWIPAGIALGIEKNSSVLTKAMDDITAMTTNGFTSSIASNRYAVASGEGAVLGGFQQNLYINSPRELSPSEVARQTRNATQQMVLSMGV
jgi:phage-related protein